MNNIYYFYNMVSVFKYCPYLNLEIYIPTVKHHQTRRKKRYEFYDSDDELYFEEINKNNVRNCLNVYYSNVWNSSASFSSSCTTICPNAKKIKIKYSISK